VFLLHEIGIQESAQSKLIGDFSQDRISTYPEVEALNSAKRCGI
jgi:hypothetical protein